jgi:hypothetical protein
LRRLFGFAARVLRQRLGKSKSADFWQERRRMKEKTRRASVFGGLGLEKGKIM